MLVFLTILFLVKNWIFIFYFFELKRCRFLNDYSNNPIGKKLANMSEGNPTIMTRIVIIVGIICSFNFVLLNLLF